MTLLFSRRTLLVAGTILAALPAATGAQVTLQLTQPIMQTPRGETLLVNALLQNSGEDTLFIGQISSDVAAEFAGSDVFDDFFNLGPATLAPGEGWEGPLLRLTVAVDASPGDHSFGVSLTGGAHPYDTADLGTAYFALNDSLEILGDGGPKPELPVAMIQAAPNPFLTQTTVGFTVSERREVAVEVYDVAGRLVRNLAREFMDAGRHELTWDGLDDNGRSSVQGLYFIRVRSSGATLMTKVIRIG